MFQTISVFFSNGGSSALSYAIEQPNLFDDSTNVCARARTHPGTYDDTPQTHAEANTPARTPAPNQTHVRGQPTLFGRERTSTHAGSLPHTQAPRRIAEEHMHLSDTRHVHRSARAGALAAFETCLSPATSEVDARCHFLGPKIFVLFLVSVFIFNAFLSVS